MSYQTILVHVDESRHLEARLRLAAGIAAGEDAHLIGVAMTGISQFIREPMATNAGDSAVAPYLDILRQRANRALDEFETVARQAGVASFERRLIDDDTVRATTMLTRYCDLAVLGQDDPDERSPAMLPGFPEQVALGGASPVLVVPYAGNFRTAAERVLIAWNASVEAAHAVRAAMPLLKRAKTVDVAIFNPATRADLYGDGPGAGITAYLARHKVKADVMTEDIGDEAGVGDALLSLAADLGAGMLVMGCYGHSRFREILLGGVTRTVLRSMTVPVLMAH